jgi:hypothetical protein
MRIWWTFVFAALGCTSGPAVQQPAPDAEFPVRWLSVGDLLRHVQSGFYVIGDSASWDRYVRSRWNTKRGYRPIAPTVDFELATVIALEGTSARICLDKPVVRRGYSLDDTLHLQLGDMEGRCAKAGSWVETIEIPRWEGPVLLDPSTKHDSLKSGVLERRHFP